MSKKPKPLTKNELRDLRDAIDSHMYWQLADATNRNSGFVIDEDASRDLKRFRRLDTKLEKLIAMWGRR